MAVRAGAYCKQGGMNKRKAGEDFYFLQKIIQLGNFAEISNTCVYPSARISDRVPFGTGRAMLEWLSNEDKHFMTYHPDSADEMKKLFTRLYNNKKALCVEDIPDCFIQFLGIETWVSKLEEIRLNTNTDDAYIQRFFKWFNLFMCFKFVHFYRDNYQKNISIKEAVIKFAPMIGLDLKDEESELRFLQIFRKWEGRS